MLIEIYGELNILRKRFRVNNFEIVKGLWIYK